MGADNKLFRGFQSCFKLSKTLSFRLIPIGKTMENIEKKGILFEDAQRAEEYKVVKRLIDAYHKKYISSILGNLKLKKLDEFEKSYFSEGMGNNTIKLCDDLRKQIVSALTSTKEYQHFFKAEMVNECAKKFAKTEEESKAIQSFKGFTTYFRGFFENRKNMYSEKAQTTGIANRAINVNLVKYADNTKALARAVSEGVFRMEDIAALFCDVLPLTDIMAMLNVRDYSQFLSNEMIDAYNTVLGGMVNNSTKKSQGINERINLFNQKVASGKLPLLKPLYKQILADRESYAYMLEPFANSQEVANAVKIAAQIIEERVLDTEKGSVEKIRRILKEGNLSQIYVSAGKRITDICQRTFGTWNTINECLSAEYEEKYPKKAKKKDDKFFEEQKKYIKKNTAFSIARLSDLVQRYKNIQMNFAEGLIAELEEIKVHIHSVLNEVLSVLMLSFEEDERQLITDKDKVALIKKFLDAIKELERFMKGFLVADTRVEKDSYFYSILEAGYEELEVMGRLYNRVRNYVTQKPYTTEKYKINFQQATLLDGWDVNKEKDNLSVILIKDDLFYLAIMGRDHRKIFSNAPLAEGEVYKKMEYKLLPDPKKMLPKVFFSKTGRERFAPSEDLIRIYEGKTFKGENVNREDCEKLINYYKECIAQNRDWDAFGFKFSDTKSYVDFDAFLDEVETQGYSLSFRPIPVDYIDQLVKEGKLYLFQIYNKDFSKSSKGHPNLFTMYWKAVFSDDNRKNPVYKLNGGAEIFFRKASIPKERQITHYANHPIDKKIARAEGRKESSLFSYDIVKDRRYTVDNFEFHVPITMNYKCSAQKNGSMNKMALEAIRSTEGCHVIGVDRGERNLIYLSLIDSDGRIIDQKSMNIIENDKGYSQNYQRLLDGKERERKKAREEWSEIASIKELKEGYLSQAIAVITDWMVRYQAIVVLEDLNFGFKNSRTKVEKQVYQKLEKMLIEKLNYYVNKKADVFASGGLYKAYQLTDKFQSFEKLGKQSGFLFYVPAWDTSKIDPTTGFVNLLTIKYTNIEDARTFIRKFDSISWDSEEKYYRFDLQYKKFTERSYGVVESWSLYTYGDRVITERDPQQNNQYTSREVNLTVEFTELFGKYGIKGEDLREAICDVSEKNFYEKLFILMRLMLQMRNSITGTDIDYIISPVKNTSGKFFDSRKGDKRLPLDADANGAYNIAKKGLWAIQQIKASGDERPKLAISNAQWLEFAQQNLLVPM